MEPHLAFTKGRNHWLPDAVEAKVLLGAYSGKFKIKKGINNWNHLVNNCDEDHYPKCSLFLSFVLQTWWGFSSAETPSFFQRFFWWRQRNISPVHMSFSTMSGDCSRLSGQKFLRWDFWASINGQTESIMVEFFAHTLRIFHNVVLVQETCGKDIRSEVLEFSCTKFFTFFTLLKFFNRFFILFEDWSKFLKMLMFSYKCIQLIHHRCPSSDFDIC